MDHLVTESDFQNWKADQVTKAFMESVNIRIEEAKDTLAEQAGLDSATDNYLRGFIRGQREILEVTIDNGEVK